MKRKIVFGFAIIILFILAIHLTNAQTSRSKKEISVNGGAENGGFTYKEDGTIELGEGFVAHGFFDGNGNLLEDLSLYVPVNGLMKGTVTLQQNREKTNYMLMALSDYEQQEFQVDGVNYQNYMFTLAGDTAIQINLALEIEENAKEVIFMIVEEPYYMELSYENAAASRHYYACRLRLADRSADIVYDKQYEEMEFISNYMFELTESHEDIRMLTSSKSGGTAKLALGSQNEEDMDYAIIAFTGWKQCPLWDEKMVQYVRVPAGKNIYYTLQLPEVEEDTPYQIFGFQNPYAQEKDSYLEMATLRTILKTETEERGKE